MKKNRMKWYLPTLMAAMMMMEGCGAGDGDSYVDLRGRDFKDEVISAVFEGEWTVNKQVVDTARLTVSGDRTLRVRLPENYLLGLCFPNGTDKSNATPIVPANIQSTVEIYPQGYSEQAQYNDFYSTTIKDENAKNSFRTCFFLATVGGELCSINLLSYENATAVMQTANGQWTLGIPVNTFLVTNQATNQSVEHKLSIPVTLYYNTKERVR